MRHVPEDRRDELLREQLIGEVNGLSYFQNQIDIRVQQLKDEIGHGNNDTDPANANDGLSGAE